MESGSPRFSRLGQIFFCVLSTFFLLVSAAGAQQPATGGQPGQDSLPAAKPLSQAATSASGAQTKTPDAAKEAIKESPDQSTSVRLGGGDLIEVSVYNVPELASKVRV